MSNKQWKEEMRAYRGTVYILLNFSVNQNCSKTNKQKTPQSVQGSRNENKKQKYT